MLCCQLISPHVDCLLSRELETNLKGSSALSKLLRGLLSGTYEHKREEAAAHPALTGAADYQAHLSGPGALPTAGSQPGQ